jgi:mannose-1-phosphate guanylyltransferase
MQAMILAAGFGTRLKPLTLKKPKALVPVGNKPVIDRVIGYLKGHGIDDIIINAHHHHQQVVEHLESARPLGIEIQVRVEKKILGTGGGIGNTADFWEADPFIVINSDILTDINISEAYLDHKRSGSMVTLILHNQPPFNQIQIDSRMNIIDIANINHAARLAFTGIHIIEPELLEYLPRGVYSDIVAIYRDLIGMGKPIRGYVSKDHHWRDIGNVESYLRANRESLEGNSFLTGPGCKIADSVELEDWAVIGENSRLEEGAEIRRSVLWENTRIGKGIRVVDSIVTTSKEITTDMKNETI